MKQHVAEPKWTKSSEPDAVHGGPQHSRSEGAPAGRSEPDQHLDSLAAHVVAAALDVHKTLGPGFLEAVYEEALAVELKLRGIPYRRQVPIAVQYKGFSVGEGRLDLLVDGALIVELKAVEFLAPIHLAQVLSYLRASGLCLGLLITFNVHQLRRGMRRVVLSRSLPP